MGKISVGLVLIMFWAHQTWLGICEYMHLRFFKKYFGIRLVYTIVPW
jgi:hypothetical protein